MCVSWEAEGGPKQKGRSRYDGVGSMTVQVEKGWFLSVARYPLETRSCPGEAGHVVKPHPQVQALSTSQSGGRHSRAWMFPVTWGEGWATGRDRDWRAPDKERDGIWHGMQGGLPGRGNMRGEPWEMEEGTCLWSRASEYT